MKKFAMVASVSAALAGAVTAVALKPPAATARVEEIACHRKAGCVATVVLYQDNKPVGSKQVVFGQYDKNGKPGLRSVKPEKLPAELRAFVDAFRGGKLDGLQ